MSHACSAIVLAAGRSTRMGRDKALLEIDGVPWWQRQRDTLVDAGATEVLLSARPEQMWTRQASGFAGVVHDALPEGGPLVGLTAGLERASQPWLMVLAVDLVALPPAWFTGLRADCAPGVGAIGRREGFFEPLAAIYPREFKWLAWEALARGEYACQRVAAAAVEQGLLRVREITAAEADWFANRNTPGEVRPRS
ncbi:MAG: molybdenum cofactor guanylyltransferase [Opitutaceae bacterium]|nr:molybdenum cofactor guanylyltransferase [Opitutaceae bacterium]